MPWLLFQVQPPASIWPISVAGWVTLVAAIAAPFAFAFGAGRVYAKLNGYGVRLAKVEKMQAEHAGGMVDVRNLMQSLMGAQATLLKEIGEATRGAATCNDGTKEMGERLANQIAKLDEKVTGWERETALELRGLTVELKARGLIDVPPEGGFTHGRRSDSERGDR
jgi:hypothetical protein